MTVSKEQISKLVRETLEQSISGDQNKELRESIAHEAAGILNEAEQLNEAFLPSIQKLMAKGLDRYRFIFLERGENRWIIIKAGSKIQGINFKGKELGDPKQEFGSEEEVESFVAGLREEKFKVVTRDGGLMRFFKAIGRGLGILILALGAMNTVVAVVVLLFMIVAGPSALASVGMAGTGAGATFIAYQSLAIGAGLVITGGGWLMMKINKKQFNADQAEQLA